MNNGKFPVLGTVYYISYDMIMRHEKQAIINHGQTVETLCSRGGLDWCELYCVLRDKPFNRLVTESIAKDWIIEEIDKYNKQLGIGEFDMYNDSRLALSTTPSSITNICLGLRPCEVIVKAKQKSIVKAHFHRWFDGTMDLISTSKPPNFIDKINCVKALVEFEDGTIGECHYQNIRFTDRSDDK